METQELKFKTNLNCGGCVSKVKDDLDKTQGIIKWSVDTTDANKILTISSNGVSKEEIENIIQRKGFKIEAIAL